MFKIIPVFVTNDFFANFFSIKLNELVLTSTIVSKIFIFTIYKQIINNFNYSSQ
jgi:hypothetical protein